MYKVNCYGGLKEGNVGEMQVGVEVQSETGEVLLSFGWGFPSGRNGTAEWLAIYAALRILQELPEDKAEIRSANKPVIQRLRNRQKSKAHHVQRIAAKCVSLASKHAGAYFILADKSACARARKANRAWKQAGADVDFLSLRAEMWTLAEQAEGALSERISF